MTVDLTPLEKEVMQLLIEGYNARDILDWLGIDYIEYLKTKNNILRKLEINRVTHILPKAIELGLFK